MENNTVNIVDNKNQMNNKIRVEESEDNEDRIE